METLPVARWGRRVSVREDVKPPGRQLRRKVVELHRARKAVEAAFVAARGTKLRSLRLADRYLVLSVAVSLQRGYAKRVPDLEGRFGRPGVAVALGAGIAALALVFVRARFPRYAQWVDLADLGWVLIFLAACALFFVAIYGTIFFQQRNAIMYRDDDEESAQFLNSHFAPAICKRLLTKYDRRSMAVLGAKALLFAGGSFAGFWTFVETLIRTPFFTFGTLELIVLGFVPIPVWVMWRDSSRAAEMAAASAD